MLKYLNISNFAVIEQVEVKFEEGLNLLTGETGSGKSIIVDSLSLLTGGRVSAAPVRTGERVAIVEGVFETGAEQKQGIDAVLREGGVEAELDRDFLIRREIHASGRSRLFIEDQNVTATTLRALQPFLIEIHGQGEQRSLLSASSQMELLDSFGGCLSLRDEVSEAFSLWRRTREELKELEREIVERDRAGDLLSYQLAEISRIAPEPHEDEELAAERKLLTHAEKLLELRESAFAELYESDESVIDRLSVVRRRLEELSAIDARVQPLVETLQAGVASLMDVADTLRNHGDRVEFSPVRLAEIEHRLAELERLKRKYNADLEGVIKIQDELSERLQRLSDLSEHEKVLRASLRSAEGAYTKAAARLTACRQAAAQALAERVMADLKHVAMEQARFHIEIQTAKPSGAENGVEGSKEEVYEDARRYFFTPYGADRVEFFLSANPGEEPRPLARVASGGELSRLMLTLRTVCLSGPMESHAGGTTIFDEIDIGIGGRVAEAVGRRLKALAESRQVLCVTHQPQIARFADHHFLVSKSVEKGRTVTRVKQLSSEERVTELARMIGGGEEGAKTTLDAARWLLESARTRRSSLHKPKRAQKILSKK